MAVPGPIRESLTLRPQPPEWLRGLRTAPASAIGSTNLETRRELGLPTDRPILMSGHQVEFWHAGVLAKLLAIDGARRVEPGVHLAWVDVDQDANQPWRIAYPAQSPTGGLVRRVWDVSGGPAREEELALGIVKALQATPAPSDAYTPGVQAGLDQIAAALGQARHAPSAAAQFGNAAFALSGESGRGIQRMSALTLAQTSLFAALVERMLREPARCCQAYNAGAMAHPQAGVRPLDARGELPLWSISPSGLRRRVFAGSLPTDGVLAPKALFMTLLLRMAACDMFVHGLGGEQYDQVMVAWARGWLGAEAVLAPAVAASATRLVAFPGIEAPTPEEIRAARWVSAHARHDPGLVGDAALLTEKRRLVQEIASLPRRSPARRVAYERLLGLLETMRSSHAAELAGLKAEATRLGAARELATIVHDRTWAFPMLNPASVDSLRSEICEAFSNPARGR